MYLNLCPGHVYLYMEIQATLYYGKAMDTVRNAKILLQCWNQE